MLKAMCSDGTCVGALKSNAPNILVNEKFAGWFGGQRESESTFGDDGEEWGFF